jgi:hypothetical protein
MSVCVGCGRPLDSPQGGPNLRSDSGTFHIGCAPAELVERASEEYQAILRKGVRYFVDKYSGTPSSAADLGVRFWELGRAIEEERERRARSPGPSVHRTDERP